jgi:hypothetical protein
MNSVIRRLLTAAGVFGASMAVTHTPAQAYWSCEEAVESCQTLCNGEPGYFEVDGECNPHCKYKCHCEGIILPWSYCS